MTGFRIDEAALAAAINKLKGIHGDIVALVGPISDLKPGELTAGDDYTNRAREVIQERAAGQDSSLRKVTLELVRQLEEKIASYEGVLKEYQAAEENATVDASRVKQ